MCISTGNRIYYTLVYNNINKIYLIIMIYCSKPPIIERSRDYRKELGQKGHTVS